MQTKKMRRFWIMFWSIEHARMQYSVDALPNDATFLLFRDYRGFGLARFGLARVYIVAILVASRYCSIYEMLLQQKWQ